MFYFIIYSWMVSYGASISVESTHSLEIGNSKEERKSWYWSGEKYLCFFGGNGTHLKNPWTVANSVRQGLNGPASRTLVAGGVEDLSLRLRLS
jgi:hypothetical protein